MNITNSITYMNALNNIHFGDFSGKVILITGATGMIGSCLIDAFMQWNAHHSDSCHIVAVSRNASTAKERFPSYWDRSCFSFLELDVCQQMSGLPDHVDYIIHAASHADPANFAHHPVETLMANVVGTHQLLSYGMHHGMARFLYVSSGEMYGQPNEQFDDFVEEYCGPVDYTSARSCYPAGKRAAEVLCQSYIAQYQTDVVIVRPCHIFGPTMSQRDSRAVSQFLMNAAHGKDIVMKSAGLLERSHCYVVDAAQAILMVLLHGDCGQSYNIADPKYQMTIKEFAFQSARAGGCSVLFENPSDLEAKGYSTISRSVLSADRLLHLGWRPTCSNGSAIQETVNILREA